MEHTCNESCFQAHMAGALALCRHRRTIPECGGCSFSMTANTMRPPRPGLSGSRLSQKYAVNCNTFGDGSKL